MNWTEILIKVSVEDTEQASAIANMTVPYGIYVEDYSDLIEQSWEIAHVDIIEQELGFPCFIKPSNSGSSVGVCKAKSKEDF